MHTGYDGYDWKKSHESGKDVYMLRDFPADWSPYTGAFVMFPRTEHLFYVNSQGREARVGIDNFSLLKNNLTFASGNSLVCPGKLNGRDTSITPGLLKTKDKLDTAVVFFHKVDKSPTPTPKTRLTAENIEDYINKNLKHGFRPSSYGYESSSDPSCPCSIL